MEYEIVIVAICSSSDCSDTQKVANQLYKQVTGDLRAVIEDGSMVISLRATSSEISALLENASISGDFSEVVVPILALLSDWYPDWTHGSNTCLNDGNAPYYMKIFGHYYESSLDTCCEKHFSWDIYTCTGNSGTVPSGFYPNWSGSVMQCFNSTVTADTLPDYMRINAEHWLFATIEACCDQHFNWSYNECVILSGGSPYALAAEEWYVNHEKQVCQQDCPEEDGGSCGGLAKSWNTLYKSAIVCCQEKLSWIASSICEAKSTLTFAVGPSQ